MTERNYTVLCPFGGSGGGALGFQQAEQRLFDDIGTFTLVGSIDFDANACADYEHFTGSSAWCVDISKITPGDILKRYGMIAPHVVFLSPPCKRASRLYPKSKANSTEAIEMNRLGYVWLRAMLEAWADSPPALILFENVDGLAGRAVEMITEVRKLLREHGYALREGSHDCGEIGGLAQHRSRFLLVARHTKKCSTLLFKPQRKRVRAIREVLETLPLPGTAAARKWGQLHVMSNLTWRNWLRIASIPSGGDWRDIPGTLAPGQKRRTKFRRHAVADWNKPIDTVTGPGGHSINAVADPRIVLARPAFDAAYGVLDWNKPARTVAGTSAPGCGAYCVADPRDRIELEARHPVGQRERDVRVMTLEEALALDLDPDKRPDFLPVIVSPDGMWHRPITKLEKAALQGYPMMVRGEPIRFHGTATEIDEHIGNSVPVGAAKAIAEQMLTTLMANDTEGWLMSAEAVWVSPKRAVTVEVDA